MNACVFDIETSDLAAIGPGTVLCAVIKPLNDKPRTFRYDKLSCKPGKEGVLIQHIFDELSRYQLWIGHNINNFDWPYLRSRAVVLDIPLIRGALSYDTLHAFRRTGFKTRPNIVGKPTAALDHVVDFFGFPQKKTKLYPREHWKAVWETGTERRKAMDAIVDHCVADVEMNEKIYWKLIEQDNVARLERLR